MLTLALFLCTFVFVVTCLPVWFLFCEWRRVSRNRDTVPRYSPGDSITHLGD